MRRRFECQLLPRRQHGNPVTADGTADDEFVACLQGRWTRWNRRDAFADSSGVDEHAVRDSAGNDFGVASNDRNAGFFGSLGNASEDAVENSDRQSFLDDECERDPPRLSPTDCQVKAFFAVAQRLFRPLAVGDVAKDCERG